MGKNVVERYEVYDEESFQYSLLLVREQLTAIGFNPVQSAKFLTAVSELARNILKYAGSGAIEVTPQYYHEQTGIKVEVIDQGSGIEDIELAMSERYSSSGTLGQGLPGAKRLVDEFDIESDENGTKVTVRSWL